LIASAIFTMVPVSMWPEHRFPRTQRCALVFLLVFLGRCRGTEPVTVFAAASMGPTLEGLAPGFASQHPGFHLEVELSSSRAACSKVTVEGRTADLVVSADADLMRELMMPGAAERLTRFAGNRLVLAAIRGSNVGHRLTEEPWQRVVATPDLRIGFADPSQAPVGARTLVALRDNDAIVTDDSLRVGAAVAARLSQRFMRPDVAKLIAPLETGEVDAAFVYESEARQYGLAYAALDPRIDGSTTTFYAATVPRRARHPHHGEALLTTLLSEEGRRVAARHFLNMLDNPVVEGEAR
jgi:molybdate transport system substrate-binding protein